jgi:hypothetical protein
MMNAKEHRMRRLCHALVIFSCLLGCGEPGTTPTTTTAVKTKPPKKDASDEFFAAKTIPHLKIELSPESEEALKANPRAYVKATLVEEGGKKYVDVGVKLKGAAGSFRELHDRPALTINMTKFRAAPKFHDIEKFHLNNSVQDESLLSEAICSELSNLSGVPATRVSHARVSINDRDLGMYVLKEGFDKPFLVRHFGDATGNLYDGGFCTDIDAELEKDSGKGVDDRSDLRAVISACQEPDPAKRHELIAKRVDVPAFLRFVALERMTAHWDGYVHNRNNYRIYFDAKTNRAVFMPHGMDQMFGDPNFPLLGPSDPIVASAVLNDPEWAAEYHQIVEEMLQNFRPERVAKILDRYSERLQPELAAMNEEAARQQREHLAGMKARINERVMAIRRQLSEPPPPPPTPVEFDERGLLRVTDWFPLQDTDAKVGIIETEGEVTALTIATVGGEPCIASWRRKLLLPAGKYRFEADAKAEDVRATEDEKGGGAGIRISGGNRENRLVGTGASVLRHEFEVEAPMEVVLVAEMRATGGSVQFAHPLRLIKLAE